MPVQFANELGEPLSLSVIDRPHRRLDRPGLSVPETTPRRLEVAEDLRRIRVVVEVFSVRLTSPPSMASASRCWIGAALVASESMATNSFSRM